MAVAAARLKRGLRISENGLKSPFLSRICDSGHVFGLTSKRDCLHVWMSKLDSAQQHMLSGQPCCMAIKK
jgi:hypothetical protein